MFLGGNQRLGAVGQFDVDDRKIGRCPFFFLFFDGRLVVYVIINVVIRFVDVFRRTAFWSGQALHCVVVNFFESRFFAFFEHVDIFGAVLNVDGFQIVEVFVFVKFGNYDGFKPFFDKLFHFLFVFAGRNPRVGNRFGVFGRLRFAGAQLVDAAQFRGGRQNGKKRKHQTETNGRKKFFHNFKTFVNK